MTQGNSAAAHRPGIWQVLSAAPHRMFFLAGTAQIVLIMVWWAITLSGLYGILPASGTRLNPVWAHAFLMIYGLFPFFIFGFLATVYPRWMNTPVLPRRAYISAFLLMTGGAALFYPGLYAGTSIVAFATTLILCGWLIILAALLRVYGVAHQRGPHERTLNLALAAGALGIACFTIAAISGNPAWFTATREIGLWMFLVPVVFGVSHRMIPFFGSSVLENYRVVRPGWSLPLVLTCTTGHAALAFWGQRRWLFVCDLPLMLTGLYHSVAWGLRRSFQERLLAMLHIAFSWFTLAMALYSIQSLVLLGSGRLLFGRAPLHALGIGFVLSMVVAMVSRVSLGHSGRALAANRLTWYTLLGACR
ncbi:MAG: NnrS family protein, partial [Acidiferrobacterales bacterium]